MPAACLVWQQACLWAANHVPWGAPLQRLLLQVAERVAGAAKPTFATTARQLLAEDGPRGLLRGLLPRMVNVSLWGTAMVRCPHATCLPNEIVRL